nr:immunoglobulin light chain junction region [Macaca mulatta]
DYYCYSTDSSSNHIF